VDGKLITLFSEAGFSEVKQQTTISTIFGTMTLYSAAKKTANTYEQISRQ